MLRPIPDDAPVTSTTSGEDGAPEDAEEDAPVSEILPTHLIDSTVNIKNSSKISFIIIFAVKVHLFGICGKYMGVYNIRYKNMFYFESCFQFW
jgi:hypothetical protein